MASTSPWIVQPKAVPTPPSISVFLPDASRAARMRPSSATTSSGVLRRLARLCCVTRRQRQQHQVGIAFECAFGALQVRHQHRRKQPGQRSSHRPATRRCRPAAAAASAARTSRPRSRAGRRRRRRGSIPSCARSDSTVLMLCSPSRMPTSRITTRCGRTVGIACLLLCRHLTGAGNFRVPSSNPQVVCWNAVEVPFRNVR